MIVQAHADSMTLACSVRFCDVLSAASMATSGETFLLYMGKPGRIVDLVPPVRQAARCAPDVQINLTGLRPGEKLHERLFSRKEERVPTANPPGIWATRPQPLPDDFASCLSRLCAAAAQGNADLAQAMLGDLLPDYAPVIDDSGLVLASQYADEF